MKAQTTVVMTTLDGEAELEILLQLRDACAMNTSSLIKNTQKNLVERKATKPKKTKLPAPEVERASEGRLWEGRYKDRDRRRQPSDRDQRRYTYTEDRQVVL